MKFRLWTILWIFAVLASAMAISPWVIVPAIAVLSFWGLAFYKKDYSWRKALGVCLTVDMAILLVVPAIIEGKTDSANRSQCANCSHIIALASQNYALSHGHFPPAYILGPDGKPWHSWRVLILPYIDEQDLYDQYDFDQPWDGPNNRKLWDQMPRIFRCPGFDRAARLGVFDSPGYMTNYFAVIGPQTTWRGSEPVKPSDVTDGLSSTLLVLESSESVCWLEPTDLSYEEALSQLTVAADTGHHHASVGFGLVSASSFCRGRMAAFADGRVEYLPNCLSQEIAAAALTINGGEELDPNSDFNVSEKVYGYGPTFFNWRLAYPLATFLLLGHLPLINLYRNRDTDTPVLEVIE